MKRCGFHYFKTTATSLSVFPPRLPAMIESRNSTAKSMSYWLRPHTSKTRLPVLYIHGIGVGLVLSATFLHELDRALNSDNKDDGEVGILAIEILQISSRLTSAILDRKEFLRQITQVLDANDFGRFVLVSHSYGSVLSTHILDDDGLSARVSATLFVDPVTFLLHMPDVAYNFTVRKPNHANEWQMWFFASQDPCIAHTLGRHFFWSENVLWRDRVHRLVIKNGLKVTASLASHDMIVDTQTVGMYLTEHQILDDAYEADDNQSPVGLDIHKKAYGPAHSWKQRPWRGSGVEVVWWEGLDHGQVFDKQATRAKLVDVCVEYCKDR